MTDEAPADLRRYDRFMAAIRAQAQTFTACRLPQHLRAAIDRIADIASGDRDHDVALVTGFIDFIEDLGWTLTYDDHQPVHRSAVEVAAREYTEPRREP